LSLQFEEQSDMNHYEVLEKVRNVLRKAKCLGIEFALDNSRTIWLKAGAALLTFTIKVVDKDYDPITI